MSDASTESACALCGGPVVRRHQFGERRVMYCRACQLGQLAPRPSEQELTSLYASRQYFEGADGVGYADYSGDAPQFARTFRAKVNRLLPYGSVRDLIEIGCGPGYFLLEARRAGVTNVVGVDRNPWAVEEARRNGLEAYAGAIDVLPHDLTFDAAAMLDLLEHVTEPVPFLRQVRERLRPGGRLFIMTPNIRSVLARISGRRWVSFKIPEHVYYYSPRSIRRLLASAGFEVLSVRGSGQYVTIAFLLSRLRRLAPRLTAPLDTFSRALMLERRVILVTNGSIDVVARVASGSRTIGI